MTIKPIAILILCTLLALPLQIGQAGAQSISTSAKQAIIVDYDTGLTLFEKEADARMPTSSMSKVMTMYLVFEALKNGQIALDDTFKVSEKAWRKGGSKMFVEVNKEVKIEDLIRGVIVQSGNDATITLAEGLAGTEDSFAMALTSKAKEIGMENTNFVNASGWPDPDHYSTARDLSIMTHSLIKSFPEYYNYYSEREFTYNDITQKNRNPLLYRDIGADGVKTGHTQVGGYGVIGSGIRNGRRVIIVVNGLESGKARAQESSKLLDWGLRSFENMTLFKSGDTVEGADVAMGVDESVELTLDQDVFVSIPLLAKQDIKANIVYEGPLEAPIQQGHQVGTLILDIPQIGELSYPVFAKTDIARVGFFSELIEKSKVLFFQKNADKEDKQG